MMVTEEQILLAQRFLGGIYVVTNLKPLQLARLGTTEILRACYERFGTYFVGTN